MRRSERSERKAKKSKNSYKERTESRPNITPIHPKNASQEALMDSIRENPITIANGPAGTGKSMVALYEGVKLLDRGEVDQILYCRPVVDFKGERGIGFLPGDVSEKIDPLLAPIKDNITNFLSPGLAEYMMSKGKIKFELLEYIRGRSLRNKFIIADEFQNSTPHSVLTVISRMEESSKLVIMGDPMQRDTISQGKDGLSDACSRLSGLSQVGIVNFSSKDIVRSSFLSSVINRYDH